MVRLKRPKYNSSHPRKKNSGILGKCDFKIHVDDAIRVMLLNTIFESNIQIVVGSAKRFDEGLSELFVSLIKRLLENKHEEEKIMKWLHAIVRMAIPFRKTLKEHKKDIRKRVDPKKQEQEITNMIRHYVSAFRVDSMISIEPSQDGCKDEYGYACFDLIANYPMDTGTTLPTTSFTVPLKKRRFYNNYSYLNSANKRDGKDVSCIWMGLLAVMRNDCSIPNGKITSQQDAKNRKETVVKLLRKVDQFEKIKAHHHNPSECKERGSTKASCLTRTRRQPKQLDTKEYRKRVAERIKKLFEKFVSISDKYFRRIPYIVTNYRRKAREANRQYRQELKAQLQPKKTTETTQETGQVLPQTDGEKLQAEPVQGNQQNPNIVDEEMVEAQQNERNPSTEEMPEIREEPTSSSDSIDVAHPLRVDVQSQEGPDSSTNNQAESAVHTPQSIPSLQSNYDTGSLNLTPEQLESLDRTFPAIRSAPAIPEYEDDVYDQHCGNDKIESPPPVEIAQSRLTGFRDFGVQQS